MCIRDSIVLYIILILMCFGVLGIETASFLALFTSGGVAIGLAFQGAVTNLAGGVMILLFHPFRVGDYIETTEIAGTVNAISVLYTVVLTPDNKRVTVPDVYKRQVFASMEDVASSSTRIFGSESKVLANAISCFWPCERREPRSFTCV